MTPKQIVNETERREDIRIQFGGQTEIQSEKDEILLKEIRFLFDVFAISDQAYHKITMKTNDLPKLYLIKNCRDRLNENIQIVWTPRNAPGAFSNFKCCSAEETPENVRIKVFGDGIKVSRISNYVVMYCSLINDEISLSSLHRIFYRS